MDEANPLVEAALMEGGVFKRVGPSQELTRLPAAASVDLQGIAVFPGFVDSHVHLLSYGLSLREVDLTSAGSIDDLLEMLRKAKKDGRVLRACQLDPESLKEKRFPTRKELDSVSKDTPMFVKRRDEHSSVLNTAAFDTLGLPQNTPGIEVDSGTGEPTGVLKRQANQIALEKFHGMIDDAEMKTAYMEASSSALAMGVTTLHALIGADENPVRKDCETLLEIQDELPVRTIPYYQTRNVDKVLRLGLERIGGCILLDGSIGSRTAAFSSDYADEPGNNGCLYLKDEELLSFFERSEKGGLQIAVHAIGDRAVEQAISCYEKVLGKSGIRDQRHRIEHAEYVKDEQWERIAKLGICLGMQPAFEDFWGYPGGMYEKRLGKTRVRAMNSFATALKNGICVAGGSDAPITPVDPILGIHSAVNHPSTESRLSVEESVRAFTWAGGYAAHKEAVFGLVKPGYCADAVGLSADPFSAQPGEIRDIKIVFVVQDGQVRINKLPSPRILAAKRGAGYA
jgi:hypothetical protein